MSVIASVAEMMFFPPVIKESLAKAMTMTVAIMANGMSRRYVVRSMSKGHIVAVRPSISSMLQMFEPTMLPRARSPAPSIAAETDTNSSGADVPIPTIVKPITKFDIFAFFASATDESTR